MNSSIIAPMNVLHDARGKTFAPDFNPTRIVSLVPSWTETLFAFGAGEQISALTDYCTHPPAGVATKQKIGGTKNPRLEEIIALKPDLVIANEEENRKADVEQLEANGIPVYVTFARGVRQALSEMETLGQLVRAANVDALIKPILATYERIVRAPRAKWPRVVLLIWREPWMTANGETYVSNLIETCGGINLFGTRTRRFPLAAELGHVEPRKPNAAQDTRYPRVSLQEVADAQPDFIFLTTEPYSFTATDAHAFDKFELSSRVRVVDGMLATWYGIRMGTALEYFSQLLTDEKA